MAQKTLIQLTDDVDGTSASETVAFALDGVAYEIDLSDDNAQALRDSLERWVRHARRTRTATSRTPVPVATTGHDPKAVRIWAAANGLQVPARGRIPGDVLAQYHAAGN
jgi:hypothetical protein